MQGGSGLLPPSKATVFEQDAALRILSTNIGKLHVFPIVAQIYICKLPTRGASVIIGTECSRRDEQSTLNGLLGKSDSLVS